VNYARKIVADLPERRAEYVFFAGRMPARMLDAPERWAFHAVPEGEHAERFAGRLVGESADVRCARMGHRPHAIECEVCYPRTYNRAS
jgi:hypothetical protein